MNETTRKKKNSIGAPAGSLERRLAVESDIVDELLLVCGVIGTTRNEGNELVPVTDCLNWLQDLQRALRRDEDLYRPISLLIGNWKVVEQKLLPLVISCRFDTAIVLTVVKILVILTKPLAENTKRAGRMLIDTSSKSNDSLVQQQIKLRENAVEQAELLIEYKRLFSHHSSHHVKGKEGTGLLSIFVSLLAEPLSKTGSARTDADHLTIELVLHLFRNLLAAEPLLNSSQDSIRRSRQLHHELVNLFEKELVTDILLVLGQELELRENSQYNLLMMELLHNLLKAQDPAAVALAQTRLSLSENTRYRSSSALSTKLREEKSSRFALVGTRHGHFGGTWLEKQGDGKRKYVSTNQSSKQKKSNTSRRNRKAEPFIGSSKSFLEHSNTRFSEEGPTANRAKETLNKFCQRFVENCYGPFMKSLKNEFRRDSVRLEDGDKVIFFRLIWFFSQWWRYSENNSLGQLIFTMDVFTFNLVLSSTDAFHLHKMFSRLEQAVSLYSEMMLLLKDMQHSQDATENEIALGLVNRIFYVAEPMDRLPKLLQSWTPGRNTRQYVCDLCTLCHVSLELLEENSKFDTMFGSETPRNNLEKMRVVAAEFDITSYFCKKLFSNQLVSMYTHLLSQYKLNSSRINDRVVAMFLRLSSTEMVSSMDSDTQSPISELYRPHTLEPMLYNIHLFLVIEKILLDSSIRNTGGFGSLVSFCTRHMEKFLATSQDNHMAFVECLFRHLSPRKFCESFAKFYMSEEFQMLAEREVLLDEQERCNELQGGVDSDIQSEDEAEFMFDEGRQAMNNSDDEPVTEESSEEPVAKGKKRLRENDSLNAFRTVKSHKKRQ
ncbi:unnamed protein product [Cylindrotheca closterium]|uniref:Timeless N-terminal domain-containing protein n=1 Tax=Cylindrotheca closterium TaxID=2856 RepID=A0AAD2GAH8_9STRA|nr:unnamed protein product [Cylindrotheca closterium]